MPPCRKILKNRSSEIETEGISGSQSWMLNQLHDQLNATAIASYSYCMCRWIWDMQADLMLLCPLYLWRFSRRSKNWARLLSIPITIFFQGSSWSSKTSYSLGNLQQILSIRCLLNGICNSDNKYLCQASHTASTACLQRATNHVNSLIVERTGFILTESSGFPRMTILPVWIYEYHFC